MAIQVTGKNIEAGEAFKTYVTTRITEALDKYVGSELSGHVRIEKERSNFRTNCHIQLRSGLVMQSQGEAADAYASAEAAVERLEKRVRRYKRRLKNHHHGQIDQRARYDALAVDYVVAGGEAEETDADSSAPVIIAESERRYGEMAVSEAVMQLDLADDPVVVFRNAAHGGLNIVYRRQDGNIGWIDPQPKSVSPDSSNKGTTSDKADNVN